MVIEEEEVDQEVEDSAVATEVDVVGLVVEEAAEVALEEEALNQLVHLIPSKVIVIYVCTSTTFRVSIVDLLPHPCILHTNHVL